LPPLFAGLGFFCGGVSLGALTTLACLGLSRLLIHYGRFHLRLLKPVVL
jgi:hypothetical protein